MKNKKVLIAMSGGVDSSVAAYLLKKEGYNLTGVFFDLGQINCQASLKSAEKTAKKIGIPLKKINLRNQFKKMVINKFLSEFKKGNTPNPCVVCNKKIKFENLLSLANKMKINYIATGHYTKPHKGLTFVKLLLAKDKTKDQSYFLYNLNQKILSRTIFPLGNLIKEQVKKMADNWKLPYLKKESQDICFLKGDHNNYLRKNLKKIKLGKIVDSHSKIYGTHCGLPFYTIGQRIDLGGLPIPYYIVAKNRKRNLLIIASLVEEKKYWKKEVKIKNVNWISGKAPNLDIKCPSGHLMSKLLKARIRYRQPLENCKLKIENSKNYFVTFNKPQRAVTSGQSLVIYKGQELIGGGIII
ncbi:tRNA 2-thiouridine(34) synthase MnmA [Patescibacteria group bacterium]|nr:tRNA 2-thiouridine(34) synthase MnmA [Patescibacteria group bacterium]